MFDIQHVSICKFTSDIRAAETYGKLVRIQYSRTTTLAADSSKEARAHAESNGIQTKSDRSTAMQLPSQKAAQTRSPLTHDKTNHRKVSERQQMPAASPVANYRPALSTCAAPKVCVCAAQFVTYCQRWHPFRHIHTNVHMEEVEETTKGAGSSDNSCVQILCLSLSIAHVVTLARECARVAHPHTQTYTHTHARTQFEEVGEIMKELGSELIARTLKLADKKQSIPKMLRGAWRPSALDRLVPLFLPSHSSAETPQKKKL